MDVSLDLKTFRDAIESMKRVLKNGKLTKISCAVFDSAVVTVKEICLRRVNNVEVSSEIKYAIDEIKKNFDKYEKFSSLSIGPMYHQKCTEKVETLDDLYKNFEAKITNKKRPPTEIIDSEPEIFRAIKVSVYGDQITPPPERKHDESNFETKLEETEDIVVNNCNELLLPKNSFMAESKSTIQDTKVGPPTNVEKITECKNEHVSNDQPKNIIPENSHGEFPNPIQYGKNYPNESSSVSSTVSSVEEEEFRSIVSLEAKLKEKTKELTSRTQEISALIEERKSNKAAYDELKVASKEFELRVLQDEVFVRFPQNLTEMLSSHHQLIREEFAELKNEVGNIGEILLTANKDLRQQIEAQEITINLLKSELQSLKVTLEEILKKKDEEVEHVINHLNDLMRAHEQCGFCSNQTDEEESRSKKAKDHTPDKINVDEDSLEEGSFWNSSDIR